jgi:hypothetical protein
MAIRNHFSESDINCITTNNVAPTSADSGSSVDFSADIVVTTGATISGVTFDWGDGNTDAGVADVGYPTPPEYTASHTYASAGSYLLKIITVLTTGETDDTWTIITVV